MAVQMALSRQTILVPKSPVSLAHDNLISLSTC